MKVSLVLFLGLVSIQGFAADRVELYQENVQRAVSCSKQVEPGCGLMQSVSSPACRSKVVFQCNTAMLRDALDTEFGTVIKISALNAISKQVLEQGRGTSESTVVDLRVVFAR